jgi:hypothetical protein
MGIPNPLSPNEVILDNLGKRLIKIPVTIVDDVIRIKEEQRDSLIKLGYDTIINQKTLTDMDAKTKRSVMALDTILNAYILLIEKYVNKVFSLIADAKDYAFNMGKKVVELAEIRAEIAEEKGAIYIQEIDLKIDLEAIDRKHVEIELLKANLSAAKAHTRLIMAEIDVKRADLRVIEVAVEQAMARLKQMQIEVDTEMVIADIIVRGLAAVKYSVESKEINAGFQMIKDRLCAVQKVIAEKKAQIETRSKSQESILEFISTLLKAEKETQQKRVDEIDSNVNILVHENTETQRVLSKEDILRTRLTTQEIKEITEKINAVKQTDNKKIWAAELIDGAQEWAAKNRKRSTTTRSKTATEVHPNNWITC